MKTDRGGNEANQRHDHLTVDAGQGVLLDRYVRAWEGADLDGLVALLRDDAVLTMPPNREWYRGRAAIRRFLGEARARGLINAAVEPEFVG